MKVLLFLLAILLSGCSFSAYRWGVASGFTTPACDDAVRCSCRVVEGANPNAEDHQLE